MNDKYVASDVVVKFPADWLQEECIEYLMALLHAATRQVNGHAVPKFRPIQRTGPAEIRFRLNSQVRAGELKADLEVKRFLKQVKERYSDCWPDGSVEVTAAEDPLPWI